MYSPLNISNHKKKTFNIFKFVYVTFSTIRKLEELVLYNKIILKWDKYITIVKCRVAQGSTAGDNHNENLKFSISDRWE